MAGVVAAALPAFLADAGERGFAWGRNDCCLILADWVMAARGVPDPAAHLRGRYSTARGCARLQRRLGGVFELVASCARGAGLERTDTPGAGDIGLTWQQATPGGRWALTGSICTGRRWACLAIGGLVSAPAEVFAAWRV